MAIFGSQAGKIDKNKTSATFYEDVVNGLSLPSKRLSSKYFYDENGDRIFQRIMEMEEYYLPACELEIIKNRSHEIIEYFPEGEIDVIELGAGDGSKTVHFLKHLEKANVSSTFYPLDISENILEVNKSNILREIPEMAVNPIHGDYFDTLKKLKSNRPRVILFMGSNIGNFSHEEAVDFIELVGEFMQPDDLFLVGIDLRKNPRTIIDAYDDKNGITKAFNLNLLNRINHELDGNFDVSKFDHYATYDPIAGTASSYIVSLENQVVRVGEERFSFKKYELIHTEVSNKYNLKEIEQLGSAAHFSAVHHFMDDRSYFSISLFKK